RIAIRETALSVRTVRPRGEHRHEYTIYRVLAVVGARRAGPFSRAQSGDGVAVRGRPRLASWKPTNRAAVARSDHGRACGGGCRGTGRRAGARPGPRPLDPPAHGCARAHRLGAVACA